MKYQVQIPNKDSGQYKTVATFDVRSSAIEYGDQFKNVKVYRKTDRTNRLVFSRSTVTVDGFSTVSQTETFRSSKPAKTA